MRCIQILIRTIGDPGTVRSPGKSVIDIPSGYEGPVHLDVIRSVWQGCIEFIRSTRILLRNSRQSWNCRGAQPISRTSPPDTRVPLTLTFPEDPVGKEV